MTRENSLRLPTIAAFSALFACAFVTTVPQASVVELGRTFVVSNASLGSIFRLIMIGFFVAAVIGGRLSDKYGKLPAVALGGILMAAGTIICSQAPSFAILPYAALMVGFGAGLVEVMGTAAISDLYSGPARTRMTNWTQVVFSAGATVQPIIFSQLLRVGIGWRTEYIIAGTVSVFCALAAVGAGVATSKLAQPAVSDSVRWYKIIRDRYVIKLSLALMLYVGAEIGIAGWAATLLRTDIHSSAAIAAASVAMFWLGEGAGRIVATHLAGKLSDNTVIRWSLGLGAIGAAVLLFIHSPIPALAAIFCIGFMLGPSWPTIISQAGNAFPTQTGSVIGIVAAAGSLGGAILPELIGRLSDSTNIRTALWASFAALILSLITMTLKSTKRGVT